MSSYRINVNLIDQSQVAIGDSTVTGAMVIKASKGPKTPIYINKGDTNRLISLYGAPSVTPTTSYTDIWEAIQFNNQEGLWVCSPYDVAADTHGGVMVTAYGTASLTAGRLDSAIATPDFTDALHAWDTETVGYGNASDTVFTLTLANTPISVMTASYIKLYIAGVEQATLTIAGAAPYTIALAGVLDGTNSTLNTTTKALSLDFASAPAAGVKIEIRYASPTTLAASTNYFQVLAKSPYADDLALKVTYNSSGAYPFWYLEVARLTLGAWVIVNEYTISFTPLAKDGFGKSIYYEDVLEDNDFIQVLYNSNCSVTGFQNDTTFTAFDGGARTVPGSITTAMVVTAWQQFRAYRTYPAQIFMSPLADPLVVQEFDTLRTTYQTYAKFIVPLPIDDDETESIATKAGYSINDRGLRFYWNWGLNKTQYGSFWSSLVGRIGVKHAQMKDVFFGKAPAWIDEQNHGGQLGTGVVEMMYDPTEDELQALDTAGINPIVFDPVYGVMIMSQKTAQNPVLLSDTSYIGHSDVIDYLFNNMITKVLTYQVCKLNDAPHRSLAVTKAYQITDPIVSSGVLAECIHKCDEFNNTSATMAQRKFIFSTAIKVTPFSERIVFNLIVTEQGAELTQVLA